MVLFKPFWRKKKKEDKPRPPPPKARGGFFFFLSLVCLLLLGVIWTVNLPFLWRSSNSVQWLQFALGSIVGIVLTHLGLTGRSATFVHEAKHAIFSGFVGNKYKKMEVDRDSGSFEYSYSKDSARYNAFISLAPYFLPIFTFPSVLIALGFPRRGWITQALILGISYGADLQANLRDISPVQSDIFGIRGGYRIGILYIVGMNLCIFALTVAWMLEGPQGIRFLMYALWEVGAGAYFMWTGERLPLPEKLQEFLMVR